jgi:hypothetical protein
LHQALELDHLLLQGGDSGYLISGG